MSIKVSKMRGVPRWIRYNMGALGNYWKIFLPMSLLRKSRFGQIYYNSERIFQ